MDGLTEALKNEIWINHNLGDTYVMVNRDGSTSDGWELVYYPLFETYKNELPVVFNEPRALMQKHIVNGFDFRELPLRYFKKRVEESE